MRKWLLATCLVSAQALAAPDAPVSCKSCHGSTGESAGDEIPNLCGQKAAYLRKQLKDFKTGERKDPTMNAMAAPLSDADVSAIASFFSAQKCK